MTRTCHGTVITVHTGAVTSAPLLTAPVPPAPMLASTGALPTDTSAYCYEVKWDGIRALARCGQRVELFSRNANHLTCFPEITDALAAGLGGRAAVLDGEVVVLDKTARPSFDLVQRRLRAGQAPAYLVAALPALYVVFDVLHLDGVDVTGRSYLQRRELLAGLQFDAAPVITSPYWTDIGVDAMYEVARDMGLEGLVVKRAASTYQCGRRSSSWIKAVVRQRSPMVVGGWIAGGGRHVGGVGSLLVGAHNGDGDLVYAGHVGSGLSDRMRRTLAAQLTQLHAHASPFTGPALAGAGGRANWVQPRLVVEVEYREFNGRRLRHPALKALAAGVDAGLVRLPAHEH